VIIKVRSFAYRKKHWGLNGREDIESTTVFNTAARKGLRHLTHTAKQESALT